MSHRLTFPLLAICFSVCVCQPTVNAAERNVLFIITDDESPTLGCYGDPIAKTPAIDAIARDGVLFRNAFATTASCSASRSVVMSGLHNHRNGQFGHQHHFHKFSSFHNVVKLSLPRVMSRAGYRTGQIGKYHVAPETVYHFETSLKGNGRNAVQMAEASRDFLTNRDDERPFFLYFATSDPHRGGGTDKTSELKLKPDLFGNKPNRKSHPDVEEAAAIAVADDERGQVAKAFIVTTRSGDRDFEIELQAFTQERLARHEYPRRIEFAESLPKTPAGKINRKILRDREAKRNEASI